MKRNITMQDIADHFGVSKVTVSKALNDKEGVSDELKEKIKQGAIDMGYRMNSIAKSLKENATYNIGVIMAERFTKIGKYEKPHESGSFYMDFYQVITKTLSDQKYSAILYILHENEEKNLELPGLYLDNKIDGFIVLGQIDHTYIEKIQETLLPVVYLDFYDESIETDSVTTDNFYGCYSVTNYLIRQNHKKIAYVGNVYTTSSIQDRFLGYYKSLLEHGLALREEYIVSDRDEKGEFIDFNYPKDMPSAFVCNCDQVAHNLIRDLNLKGFRVPEDVSVVGFDNSIYSTISSPQITTVEVNISAMAQASVELLLKKIQGLSYQSGRQAIRGTVIYRDSVQELIKEY